LEGTLEGVPCRWWYFFSSRRRHTRCLSDWSSAVCSSDLVFSASYIAQVRVREMSRLQLVRDVAGAEHARGERHQRTDDDEHCVRSEERRVGKECSPERRRDKVERKQQGYAADGVETRARV